MGDQGSLSSFHSDIVIIINFQEESSLISFGNLEVLTKENWSSGKRVGL